MKGGFGDIKKKSQSSKEAMDFIEGAKVDGDKRRNLKALDPRARRGKHYKNKDGEIIELNGKIQQIPLNEYELKVLEEAALRSNLSITTYIRSVALAHANDINNA